jgi:hypothetical protein
MTTGTQRPAVFVQANAKQMLGARVAAHSLRITSSDPGAFDVRILSVEDFPVLARSKGRSFKRAGHDRVWDPDDLQSFTPLRFAVPDAMGHQGRAVVIDPDVFAVADVRMLLDWDMEGKPVWCRPRPGHNDSASYLATSVMLLDCGALPDWDFGARMEDLWAGRLDYVDWIELRFMDRDRVGLLPPEWNDFDRLTPETKLLHTTKRRTQPWKTGLPIDFTVRERPVGPIPAGVVAPVLRAWTRRSRYRPHPDQNQERYFFSLLADLLDTDGVTEAEIRDEVSARHVRQDALHLVDRYRGQFWPAELPGRIAEAQAAAG